MSRLEVVELRKKFGLATVVDGVSFHVAEGEVFGLLGPNGAGKTTTMSMVARLIAPDAGEIRWDGQSIHVLPRESRRLLGIAPQDLAIYPELSARENLEFFGRLYGLAGSELRQRCDDVLDEIGLTSSAENPAGYFSGGMKRRLNFGVAIVHRPMLLILDEPTVGVDPQSRSHLLECVRAQASRGAAVIYASHYMEEVSAICSRVAILDHGRVLAQGRLDDLLHRVQQELALQVAGLSPSALQQLKRFLPPESSATEANNCVRLLVRETTDDIRGREWLSDLRHVLNVLDAEQVELLSIETHQSSLERLFLELTGRSLRD